MTAILTITLNPTVDIFSEADLVRPVRKIRTLNERRDPGGGGVNVARVITAMGGAGRGDVPGRRRDGHAA